MQIALSLSSSNSVVPRFHLIYDLFDTNVPITKIVYRVWNM